MRVMMGNPALRLAMRIAAIAGCVVLGVLLAVWLTLRASLPQLDGERQVAGLHHDVVVERDALGVPTIRGTSREDVYRATGFLHAQDRFFQMDLQRRFAAGELSALLGPAALNADRDSRWHRFRARAHVALAGLAVDQRAALEAYAGGVNEGLAALDATPFEYLVLRSAPGPWKPEDSLLVACAFFLDLQSSNGRQELSFDAMDRTLHPALVRFLVDNGSVWSARIDGTADAILPLPGPEAFRGVDLGLFVPKGVATVPEELVAVGSNNWAVAGDRTTRGGAAILANDMHLSLRNLPRTWYRIRWQVKEGDNARLDATGYTLPGVPVLLGGSNGHIAWGYTTAYSDTADVVLLEPDPENPGNYLTPTGRRPIERHVESIDVRGGTPVDLTVEETIWGPVLPAAGANGQKMALAWVAHEPAWTNLDCLDLVGARSIEEAVAVAQSAWFPVQNLVVAGSDGRIAWTIMGTLPRREGFDGRRPVSMASAERRWDGLIDAAQRPVVVDPGDGVLWTANAQVIGGEAARVLGDGGFPVDGRAWQIRERLRMGQVWDEIALFEIQKDSRVSFLHRWRELALQTLDDEACAGRPARAEMRRLLTAWGGDASKDSAGYRLLRRWRLAVAARILGPLLAECRKVYPRFAHTQFRYEEPLWLLASMQPAVLLPPGRWREVMLAAADETIADTSKDGTGGDLAQRTWGEINYVDMGHPLARSVPGSWWLLGAAKVAVSGDAYAPNAHQRAHGPSERMVVAPGREEAGIMHLPGGQSGHPLSPYFLAGHEAWVRGEATAFLPGPPRHSLILRP